MGAVASWWSGGSRDRTPKKGREGVPLTTRLKRVFGWGRRAERSPAKGAGKDKGKKRSRASRRRGSTSGGRRSSKVCYALLTTK